MEGWQVWFMIGSGIYLILLGIFMFRKKDASVRKVIGVYNVLIGIFSIIAAVAARYYDNIASMIFMAYVVVLIISFIIFSVLRATEKHS
ncbi:hypothetical protein [Clostridium sp. ZS2-4]|uniref:hypothetical protein n=1 Tax=Clostridium sp. ZS2-4 TaxID=2987703 RepID=UPI00227A60E7|nr:hypothetical protein [Clostridium sp. ZS2-4]MCY6355976.1 hypothetical protein [Clostridium sp. ZS2-4]